MVPSNLIDALYRANAKPVHKVESAFTTRETLLYEVAEGSELEVQDPMPQWRKDGFKSGTADFAVAVGLPRLKGYFFTIRLGKN